MESELISRGFIPLSKSWMIRMGILDLLHGYNDSLDFLESQKDLGDDLIALKRVIKDWKNDKIEVGESATLYRFVQFASWKLELNKEFIKRGTLKERKITNNPEIVSWPLEKLLTLDDNTSQWASASVLLGNKEKVKGPYHLSLTYDAVSHWNSRREKGETWIPRYDKTILDQALTYIELRKNGESYFIPGQVEDYCFARAFNLIGKKEGQKKWPELASHESNRLEEMEICLERAKSGEIIESKDHRVVHALAMLYKIKGKEIKFAHPEAVNKSWPQFWDFLKKY